MQEKKCSLPCFSIDMQLRAFWRTFAFYDERRFVKGRVLLTGATGFLGVFLLRELLLQTRVSNKPAFAVDMIFKKNLIILGNV